MDYPDMEDVTIWKTGDGWRLTLEMYVQSPLPAHYPNKAARASLEKSLKRLLFKLALKHCTDEFRRLIRRVIQTDKRRG